MGLQLKSACRFSNKAHGWVRGDPLGRFVAIWMSSLVPSMTNFVSWSKQFLIHHFFCAHPNSRSPPAWGSYSYHIITYSHTCIFVLNPIRRLKLIRQLKFNSTIQFNSIPSPRLIVPRDAAGRIAARDAANWIESPNWMYSFYWTWIV